MNWEDAYHTEALKAREAAARVDALISELGDDAAAAVDAEADGADSRNGFRHITVLLHETVDMLKAGPGKSSWTARLAAAAIRNFCWSREPLSGALTAMRTPAAPPCSGWRASVPVSKSSPATSRTWKAFFPAGGFPVDGLLADLGVSSHQLDTASRGFSFREDGPLDMRMDTRAALSARNLVNEAPEEEIANILWQFGENALPAPLPAPW